METSPPSPGPEPYEPITAEKKPGEKCYTMIFFPTALLVLAAGVLIRAYSDPATHASQRLPRAEIPAQAQFIDQKGFNVLPTVPPPSVSNATTFFVPPGYDAEALKEKPFHVYDEEFCDVIGSNPTLTLIANAGPHPLFHEATTWYPPTDEMFFVQNAGAPAAGTGLNKSSIVLKIALSEAAAVSSRRNATGSVNVQTVDSSPMVINPNGGTNYKGQILFAGEGQGADVPPELIVMNPVEPYNTTVLLNNCFGRQFNSLNDVSINPRNKDIYFTDTLYGYLQDFRPAPGLQNQVYRLNDVTGAVTVVADGFSLPNGVTFSPNGSHAYVADTGANRGFWGWNQSYPATLYRYGVQEDGTFENRKVFAFIDSGVPDGVHCDSKGNVYAGCGDGVQVWNPSGKLIGKIYLGEVSANFNFAGKGRMVICAEENLYYVTLAASGGGYIEA
ncbi:Uu.00g011590.m01.CDS01 [Anthostomella pinea]|uniref:Uu.00g011590.m01.CDS01 n=1 Tax=Anthostomella pinea TaxID=933095 RepID=A0AAI8YQ62_9PEZI|nr:Uu.00g011590.m01.CDS01 [Anthostomella pinea]